VVVSGGWERFPHKLGVSVGYCYEKVRGNLTRPSLPSSQNELATSLQSPSQDIAPVEMLDSNGVLDFRTPMLCC